MITIFESIIVYPCLFGYLLLLKGDGVVKSLHIVRCCNFFYHYDVPYVRRNNRKIARLQYEVFYLSSKTEVFTTLSEVKVL